MTVDPAEIELSDDERGPGYGIRTADADAAAELLARTEGIFVDPVYTAKALAGLAARVRDGRLTRAGRVLARRRDAGPVRGPARRLSAGARYWFDARQASRSLIRPAVWSTAPE